MSKKNNKTVFFGKKRLQYYDGLLIRADLGLHQQIAERVQQLLPKGSSILDLGAGQGALSARLGDLGYTVTAVDIDPEDFKCKGIQFIQVNFNDNRAIESFKDKYQGTFDLVIGVEVIEHVENPWEYVRLLKALAKTGGHILISTPNVTSWLSRIHFLLKGKFHQFGESDLSYGHIAPITPWELSTILKYENFKDVSITSAGTLPPVWIAPSVTTTLANMLFLLVRPFSSGVVDGWCIMAVARKM
ncbi:MAG: class I SAM-dependent methyltransferase [Nitrospirota bacterium]